MPNIFIVNVADEEHIVVELKKEFQILHLHVVLRINHKYNRSTHMFLELKFWDYNSISALSSKESQRYVLKTRDSTW